MIGLNDPGFLAAALADPKSGAVQIAAGIDRQDPAVGPLVQFAYAARDGQHPGGAQLVAELEKIASRVDKPLGPQAVAAGAAPYKVVRPTPQGPPPPQRPLGVRSQPAAGKRPHRHHHRKPKPNAPTAPQDAAASSAATPGGASVSVSADASAQPMADDGGYSPDPDFDEVADWDDEDDSTEAAGGGQDMGLATVVGHMPLSGWLRQVDYTNPPGSWVGSLCALATAARIDHKASATLNALTVHDGAVTVCLTSHVHNAQMAETAKQQGQDVSADTCERAAILRIARLLSLVLRGQGILCPSVDGKQFAGGQYSGRLAKVYGIAPLGDYLKGITYFPAGDSMRGCVTLVVGAVTPAPDASDPAQIVADGSHDVDLCITIPYAALRADAAAIHRQAWGVDPAAAERLTPATLATAAQLRIARVVCNVLRGEAFLMPAEGTGSVAAGFDLWKDLIAPGVKSVASMVVGPAAAEMAVNTVGAIGGAIGGMIGGGKKAPRPGPPVQPPQVDPNSMDPTKVNNEQIQEYELALRTLTPGPANHPEWGPGYSFKHSIDWIKQNAGAIQSELQKRNLPSLPDPRPSGSPQGGYLPPAEQKVTALAQMAKSGDEDAKQAVAVLSATNDVRKQADAVQAKLQGAVATSKTDKADATTAAQSKARSEGIIINVGVPNAGTPVNTRYQPPPLAVAASGATPRYAPASGKPGELARQHGAWAYNQCMAGAAVGRRPAPSSSTLTPAARRAAVTLPNVSGLVLSQL